MITTIIAIVIALMIFSALKELWNVMPVILMFGFIYWTHFYIWDWISWTLGILAAIGYITYLITDKWKNE